MKANNNIPHNTNGVNINNTKKTFEFSQDEFSNEFNQQIEDSQEYEDHHISQSPKAKSILNLSEYNQLAHASGDINFERNFKVYLHNQRRFYMRYYIDKTVTLNIARKAAIVSNHIGNESKAYNIAFMIGIDAMCTVLSMDDTEINNEISIINKASTLRLEFEEFQNHFRDLAVIMRGFEDMYGDDKAIKYFNEYANKKNFPEDKIEDFLNYWQYQNKSTNNKTDKIVEALKDVLKDGEPMEVSEIKEQMENKGFGDKKWATIKVIAARKQFNKGARGFWTLPNEIY